MDETGGIAALSPRELEIAQAYSGGASYREIAERLFIAPTTVRTHLQTIYRKLGVSSKVDLFRALEVDRAASMTAEGEAAQIEFPERPSIAVLPFMSMPGDPEQEFFADGLTEDIITRLSFLRGLVVLARTSSFSFKGRAVRVQDIASDLGAKFLLEGSVRKAGDLLRITAQLIDGETGAHLWAERFDRELTEVFDVQDEITRAIAIAMQVLLTDGEIIQSDPGWTNNIDAWEKYHKGVMAHLAYTAEDERRARRLFQECLDHDPNFIDARVCLAWTYWQDSRSGYSRDRRADLSICRKLVDELKASGAETANAKHLEAATLLLEWRHDEALGVAAEAVAMGPCKLFGFTPSALVNIYSGKLHTGNDLLRMTIRLTPYTPNDVVYNLAWVLSSLGDHRNAIQCAKDYLARVPSDLFAYLAMAKAYAFSGDVAEARGTMTAFRERYPIYTIRNLISHEPYQDQRELDRLAETFREIGLPE